jgi:hypothetical protein
LDQWLPQPGIDDADMRLFPDFDDNPARPFARKTELFFESILRIAVLDLGKNYTFLDASPSITAS